MKFKMWIGLILSVLSVTASAKDVFKGVSTPVRFEGYGTFFIRLQEQVDAQPFILSLNVQCEGQSTVLKRLLTRKVCEYRGFTEDKENKTLTLHYSRFNDVSDGAPSATCSESLGYIVDIKIECDGRKP